MVMLLPAIGEMGVPSRVRLVLALAIVFRADAASAEQLSRASRRRARSALAILIAQEVTAGVLVGAMARIIMSALQVAGYLIATQTGLAYAQTLDPTQNTQGAVVGNFMIAAGHHPDFPHQPASSGDRRHRRQLSHAAAGRHSADRRHGATGDPAHLFLLCAGLSAGRAVPGVRLRGLCRARRAGAADAAVADFLCRGAAQHHVRLS